MMAWVQPAPTNTYLALDKGEGDGQAGDYSGGGGLSKGAWQVGDGTYALKNKSGRG